MTSEINEATHTAIVAANCRKPLKTDWGFCCFDQGPANAGGGVNCYFWFKDKGALFAFLKNHSADLTITFDLDVDGGIGAKAQEIAKIFPDSVADLNPGSVMTALNAVLDRYISFAWIGAFDDLVSAPSAYATNLRESFREENNETDRAVDGFTPLQKHEMADFRRFLVPA